MHAQPLQSWPTLCDPMDCACQTPLSIGFSLQECWSGLPCPPPGDLPDSGMEPASHASPAMQQILYHWAEEEVIYAKYIMRNAGLDEAQAVIKIARRNINNLRYTDDSIFVAESKEELKSLLMKWKRWVEKVGLNFNIQNTKIMASGPITSRQIYWETMKTVRDFIFLGSKITADGDCSHEIKRRLLLGRKLMTNLDSILKELRHYFANKGPSSQGYGFSNSHVWMWELDYKESWAPKNWCFWTAVLEKTLESPLDFKEIQPVHPKGDQLGVHWKDWCWSWNSNPLATW